MAGTFDLETQPGSASSVRIFAVEDAPPSEGVSGVSPAHLVGVHLGRPGRVRQRRDDGSFEGRFQPGHLTSVPAGCRVTCFTDTATSFAHVHIGHDFLRRVRDDLDLTAALPGRFRFDDVVSEQLVRGMVAEAKLSGSASRLFLEAGAVVLAQRLLRTGADQKRQPGLSPLMLGRIKELILARLAHNPGLEELAAAIGMSPRNLSRMFKRSTGLTVHGYVARARLELARDLLLRSDRPVTDIALDVGFDNPSQFAAFFRRYAGVTPSRFRAVSAGARAETPVPVISRPPPAADR